MLTQEEFNEICKWADENNIPGKKWKNKSKYSWGIDGYDNLRNGIPQDIGLLNKIKAIKINRGVRNIPKGFSKLTTLEYLHIKYTDKSINDILKNLKNLKVIDLKSWELEKFPKEIYELIKLEKLYLQTDIKEISKEINKLINLKVLVLYGGEDQIEKIPKELCELENLEQLELPYESIDEIPKEIQKLQKLKKLNLSGNNISNFNELCKLKNLETLDLSYCQITEIPKEITKLQKLKKLNLSDNEIRDFSILSDLNLQIFNEQPVLKTKKNIKVKQSKESNMSMKNIILYGSPGVGKTHNTEKLIALIEEGIEEKEVFKTIQENKHNNGIDISELKERIKFVTFHQSFGYEDFIEGFRPNEEANIKLQDGIFKSICDDANNDRDNAYYLVIDEINRGNISKIFGELITLIEEDKRDTLEVTLPYSKKPFKIPSNLYIIGTMNSTDKSIALIDIALRRRFTFLKMAPNLALVNYTGAKDIMAELNKEITETLGADYVLGHSYFMKIQNDDDLDFVLEYKIKPLLEEYFYGDKEGLDAILEIVNEHI